MVCIDKQINFPRLLAEVLKETAEACVEGKSVKDLCIQADKRLEEETGKAFKKDKKVQKGETTRQTHRLVRVASLIVSLYIADENVADFWER